MPGSLNHSPAEIVQTLLIDLGYGVSQGNLPWPVFVANEPETPDNCVTVYDTVGRQHGRTFPDGERQEHHGIQVRIRAALHEIGYRKARQVAVALDEEVYRDEVTVDTSEYRVHSITRVSDIVPLPKPMNTGKIPLTDEWRAVFVINALVSLRLIDEVGDDDVDSDVVLDMEFGEGEGESLGG